MTARRVPPAAVLVALLAAAAIAPGRAVAEDVKIVPTRPGVTVPVLVLRRPTTDAIVVLLTGGSGYLGLDSGALKFGGNFLVRSRARFAEGGMLVAIPDVSSDRGKSLDRFRLSAEHAEDMKAVIAALRAMVDAPVWLVGTSSGTISAASVAARLRTGGPDGLVLTSSLTRMSRGRGESVSDVKLTEVRVPTLVVHHREDTCEFTPWIDAKGLPGELTNAPRREFIDFSGGDPPRSEPCEAYAAHGYLGIEDRVVAAIVRFIRDASPKR